MNENNSQSYSSSSDHSYSDTCSSEFTHPLSRGAKKTVSHHQSHHEVPTRLHIERPPKQKPPPNMGPSKSLFRFFLQSSC